jgi:hypothetical protein
MHVDMVQEAYYNGYHKFHGLRVQHIIDASSMITCFATALRDGDSKVFVESGMKLQIASLFVNGDANWPVKAVTDSAYTRDDHTLPSHMKAELARMPPAQRLATQKQDSKNNRFRREEASSRLSKKVIVRNRTW